MNWDAVGAVGELVGAIAVVFTLGYLALQMKQNTVAIRAQSLIARTNEIDQSLREIALSEDLSDIYHRLNTQGVSSLTAAEKARAVSWERAKIQRMSAQAYLWENGLLDEDEYQQLKTAAQGSNELYWIPLKLNVRNKRVVEILELQAV